MASPPPPPPLDGPSVVCISPHRPPFASYAPHTPVGELFPQPSEVGMSDPHSTMDEKRPSAEQEAPQENDKGLKPFLGLGPRLWLTVFNPGFLPLIFTIASVATTRKSTAQLADQLRNSVLEACSSIANGAGTLQAIPRYLAMQTNAEVLRATRATVLAVGKALMNCITVIEVVLEFIIDTYRSMLMCTIQLAVQGTLEVLIGAVQTISDAITSSLNAIRANIQEDIGTMNNVIQAAVRGINRVTSLVNVDLSVPQITIPSLDFLANVTVPTGFEDSLIKLNNSMPTLNELRDSINRLIETPFEALKAEINETRLEIAGNLSASTFPVPSLQSLGAQDAKELQTSLCGDLDTGFIDDTAAALHKLGTVAIGLMCLLLVLGWCVLAFYQWQRWNALKNTVSAVEDEWARGDPKNAWTVVAVVESPFVERFIRPIMDRFRLEPRTRTNLRWFLSYLGHPTCLTLLIISVAGLIIIQVQIAALHAIKHQAQASASESIGATSADIQSRLNALLAEASGNYSADMNTAIVKIETKINEDMFGHWVNHTSVNLNNTLAEFYDDVEKVISKAFNGTILFNPINNFVYCILGSKIDTLAKGLTWVHENAYIDLPTVPSDVLQLSNDSTAELSKPIAMAAVGSESDPDSGAVGKLVKHFQDALEAQKMVYGIVLAAYGVLVLLGLLVVVWNSGGRDKWAARRADSAPGGGSGSGTRSLSASTFHLPDIPIPRLFRSKSNISQLVISRPMLIERAHTATPTPAPTNSSHNGGSLGRMAAVGDAFLNLRSYVPSPEPKQAVETFDAQSPRDNSRKWARLDSTYEGHAEEDHGFWVTKATQASAHVSPPDQSPGAPESSTTAARRLPPQLTPFHDAYSGEKSVAPLSPHSDRSGRNTWEFDPDQTMQTNDTTVTYDTRLLTPPRQTPPRQRKGKEVSPSGKGTERWDEVDAMDALGRGQEQAQRRESILSNGSDMSGAGPFAGSYNRSRAGSLADSLYASRRPSPETTPIKNKNILNKIQDWPAERQRQKEEARVDPFYYSESESSSPERGVGRAY